MAKQQQANPFRPGAGHMPPYLAGREKEKQEFSRLLDQEVILENLVLTGLRGLGKTVLLDTFKPMAIAKGWLWVGADLSESTSISELRLSIRLITDLAPLTSNVVITEPINQTGFHAAGKSEPKSLNYDFMIQLFEGTNGLVSDKLKMLLETIWSVLKNFNAKGIVFAYDEAQNLADHSKSNEFPLSLLLDTFQSLQKKGLPLLLALVGLPTLFPKLVEARTFAERMFHVVFLKKLDETACKDAIGKPIQSSNSQLGFTDPTINLIIRESGGYPYFIQFICREVFDAFLYKIASGVPAEKAMIPIEEITRKLDNNFFAGRWARTTDRQRELLSVIANLENCDEEFTVQEVAEKSASILEKPFSPSHVNQMLISLGDAGLVYKNRHGKYSFAVPLLGRFILRQRKEDEKSGSK